MSRLKSAVMVALLLILICANQSIAQSYELRPIAISSGGTNVSNGTYSLVGSFAVSPIRLVRGGVFEMQQGPWRFLRIYYNCCIGIRGNVDADEREMIDLSDLAYLQSYLVGGGASPTCSSEANVNGAGTIDLSDLSYMIAYLTAGGPPPVSCP